MAKLSKIVANERRKKMVARYRDRRTELRNQSVDVNLSEEERQEARVKLAKLPVNSSPCRVRNRCRVTGRPRGVLSKFQLSRIAFREMALKGEIPGVIKASW